MHEEHGESYGTPGFHSGYNEVILSAERYNAQLPTSLEAFVVLDRDHAFGSEDGVGIDVGRAHRNFLHRYKLSEDRVPLLRLDPWNWHSPFQPL